MSNKLAIEATLPVCAEKDHSKKGVRPFVFIGRMLEVLQDELTNTTSTTTDDYIESESDAWFERRKSLLTASRVAPLFIDTKYTFANEGVSHFVRYFVDPSSKPKPDGFGLWVMNRGSVLEHEARAILECVLDEEFEKHPGLLVDPKYPCIGATDDALLKPNKKRGGGIRLVEFKAPWALVVDSRYAMKYWIQMQIQMGVTSSALGTDKVDGCYMVQFAPAKKIGDKTKMFIRLVERRPDWYAIAREEISRAHRIMTEKIKPLMRKGEELSLQQAKTWCNVFQVAIEGPLKKQLKNSMPRETDFNDDDPIVKEKKRLYRQDERRASDTEKIKDQMFDEETMIDAFSGVKPFDSPVVCETKDSDIRVTTGHTNQQEEHKESKSDERASSIKPMVLWWDTLQVFIDPDQADLIPLRSGAEVKARFTELSRKFQEFHRF